MCVSVCVSVHIVDVFTEAYERLGLQLNIKKTKVLFQPAPGAPEMADPVIVFTMIRWNA